MKRLRIALYFLSAPAMAPLQLLGKSLQERTFTACLIFVLFCLSISFLRKARLIEDAEKIMKALD